MTPEPSTTSQPSKTYKKVPVYKPVQVEITTVYHCTACTWMYTFVSMARVDKPGWYSGHVGSPTAVMNLIRSHLLVHATGSMMPMHGQVSAQVVPIVTVQTAVAPE